MKSVDDKIIITIYKAQNLKTDVVYSETVVIKEILEIKLVKKVVIPDFGELEFEVIWINSKINYYMKMINHYEQRNLEEERSLNTMEQSLKFMEEPFKKFLVPSQEVIKHFRSELEVSERIENFILRIIGKHIILWEKVFFFVNKIMCLILFISFLFRSDYITLIICTSIFGFELSMLSRKNYSKILIFMGISWFLDNIWLMFYLSKWHIGNIQETIETVGSYRQISVIASGANTMLKLVQLFSLWRLAITEKVKKINPLKKRKNKSLFENLINSPYHRESINTEKKSFSFPAMEL